MKEKPLLSNIQVTRAELSDFWEDTSRRADSSPEPNLKFTALC
jgi:hypothetical protein